MATMTIRLDDQRHGELERLARERGSTVSDMVRLAIDGLLRRDVPHSLDMVARRSLALLHEILALLDPDPVAQRAHQRSVRVLSKGYRSEYDREFYAFDTELPPADGSLLMDLDEDALAEIGNNAPRLLTFGGFDYQEPRENQLIGFAEHLINDERWTSLAHHFGDRPGEPDCPNSHSPMLERYQRLLGAYQAVIGERAGPDGIRGIDAYRLEVDDLKTVYAAAIRRPGLPEW